ncbi:hypothetical protein ACTG4Q_21220 [Bradyrhizobium denitrificans]
MTEQVTNDMVRAFTSEARRLLALFQDPEWRGTPEQTDEEHAEDFAKTLARTRQIFPDMPEKTSIHWVGIEGDLAVAITGNAPASGDRAKAIVGFLRNMPFLLDAVEKLVDQQDEHSARVTELIEHNTTQLLENRTQRDTIRQLQGQVDLLLKSISALPEAS